MALATWMDKYLASTYNLCHMSHMSKCVFGSMMQVSRAGPGGPFPIRYSKLVGEETWARKGNSRSCHEEARLTSTQPRDLEMFNANTEYIKNAMA
jgi:hypothetical protein